VFGPWPEWICGGDLWGYGAEMDVVRRAAQRLALVRETQPTTTAEGGAILNATPSSGD
jgi:hypothetical protein